MFGLLESKFYYYYYGVCCVSLFLSSLALARNEREFLSCGSVAEVFAKRMGTVVSGVPLSPISDVSLTVCSETLVHTKGTSCCNADMENIFIHSSVDYLRKHIRMSNSKLKHRIIESLRLYQDHLRLSVNEAYNKTSDTLTNLYKIPQHVHKSTIDSFFGQLSSYLMGNDQIGLTAIIDNLFVNLFPIVFKYVLSDSSKPKHLSDDFDRCLVQNYDSIQPFDQMPKHLKRKMESGLKRTRVYAETLKVMVASIDSTDMIVPHADCKKAISRLQFCSICSEEAESRPCRGLCLNVMRGCLSGVSEISSSWDDLVVDFGNLHVGMFRHNNAQELVSFLDGNITDCLLHAMDDGPRIFRRVMDICGQPSQSMVDSGMYKKFFRSEGLLLSHASHRIQSIRKDIASLVADLEESKGFFQRLADGLCRVPVIYDQEMQSDQCWNGSAIGRYMREVPEANTISQAKHNMEVRVTLIPDSNLLQVKDTLTHMKMNLSALYNEELMQSDQSYKTVVGSGDGYNAGRDLTDDDEDFVDRNSGSGSADGDDEDDNRSGGGKQTFTSRPLGDVGRGQGGLTPGSGGTGGGSRTGDGGRDKGNIGGNGNTFTMTMPIALLYACVGLSIRKL